MSKIGRQNIYKKQVTQGITNRYTVENKTFFRSQVFNIHLLTIKIVISNCIIDW